MEKPYLMQGMTYDRTQGMTYDAAPYNAQSNYDMQQMQAMQQQVMMPQMAMAQMYQMAQQGMMQQGMMPMMPNMLPMMPNMQMGDGLRPPVMFFPVPVAVYPDGLQRDSVAVESPAARRQVAPEKNAGSGSRKVFVGGLRPESTAETLRGYFEWYGDVADCVVINRAGTKECRGFGFVEFVDKIPEGIFSVRHTIDQRRCAVRPYDYSAEEAHHELA
jgi:hypothetical protein